MKAPLFLFCLASLPVFSATTVVDLTGLTPFNQANLTNTGQTFTTGILGLDTQLASVGLEGPQTGATTANYTIEVWTDTDGDHGTWDPGTLLGISSNSAQLANNAVSLFNFSGVTLADNTVYTLKVGSDGGTPRFGLVGSGGGNLYSDGSLFQGGSRPFNNNFDASFSVTTESRRVPSGGSTALMMGAGLLGLAGVKRKLR